MWGYYLRDEPPSNQWPLMKKQQDVIRAAQPEALVFINLGPPHPQGYEKGYDSYIKTVQPDILSLDTYPTFGGLKDDGSPTSDTREKYFADLNVTRAAAQKATRPTPWWVYFNAVEFEWCDNPTESQIAWQIYAALAYGAKGVMYFFYQNPLPPCGRPFLHLPGIVDINGKPSEKYHQARRINSAVSRHDIAGIRVAFFQECQQYRCGQVKCARSIELWFHAFTKTEAVGYSEARKIDQFD